MKLEVEVSDVMINQVVLEEIKKTVQAHVKRYAESPQMVTEVHNVIKHELNKLAANTVSEPKIKELMDAKAQVILPEALNDKFAGAYIAVMVSEAREAAKKAVQAIQQFDGVKMK